MNAPLTQVPPIVSESTWRSLDEVLSAGIRTAKAEDEIDGILPTRVVEPATFLTTLPPLLAIVPSLRTIVAPIIRSRNPP